MNIYTADISSIDYAVTEYLNGLYESQYNDDGVEFTDEILLEWALKEGYEKLPFWEKVRLEQEVNNIDPDDLPF